MSVPKRQHAVERTPEGSALSALAVQVFRLEGLLSEIGDELAAPAGQTTARWRVLAAVEHEPKPVARIAREWSLARQSVQRLADVLADEGLVTYEDNPAHRRAKLVRLSPSGRRALTRIQRAQVVWANELGAAIGLDDLAAGARVLDRLLAALVEPCA
ncbi:MAG TPA: MarR family winged helix-turn-helix transcriptional regulator [Gaiellaceae bacterium]|nr:MarR family winged helix-turn-helix transcriptional regulator [Gaiellaceae bacterium]